MASISNSSDEKCLHQQNGVLYLYPLFACTPLEQTAVTWQHFIHGILFDAILLIT